MSEKQNIDVGDRVILAVAQGRSRDVLGTVIDQDPYRDRDVLVEVLHEDGSRRWRRRDALRRLDLRAERADLAAELAHLLGDAAPAWTRELPAPTKGGSKP